MSEDLRASDAVPRTLDGRLNWLFDTIRPIVRRDDGERVPYSKTRLHHNKELAKHLGVTASYVSQLKSGKKPNPTAHVLKGIATFFDIPAAYFLSDPAEAARVEAEILYKVGLRRFEDRELPEPPVNPASSGPHHELAGAMPDSSATLCERLNWLFDNVHSAEAKRPYTEDEVAEAIQEKPFVVRGLRTGEMTDSDVSVAVLRKLAAFFGKKHDYLYADDRDTAGDEDADKDLVELFHQLKEIQTGLINIAERRLRATDRTGTRHQARRRVLAALVENHFANETQPGTGLDPHETGR